MIKMDDLVIGKFYFLRFNDGDLTVGEWDGRDFNICGSDFPVNYEEFRQVDLCHNESDFWVGEQYADEFEQEVTPYKFFELFFGQLKAFTFDMLSADQHKTRPMHEWIEMLLDWAEYNEYLKYKNK